MLKFKTFKTGISPSMKSLFNLNNLTGQQKLDLIKCRIFGGMIGGNLRNGLKLLKQNLKGPALV